MKTIVSRVASFGVSASECHICNCAKNRTSNCGLVEISTSLHNLGKKIYEFIDSDNKLSLRCSPSLARIERKLRALYSLYADKWYCHLYISVVFLYLLSEDKNF